MGRNHWDEKIPWVVGRMTNLGEIREEWNICYGFREWKCNSIESGGKDETRDLTVAEFYEGECHNY